MGAQEPERSRGRRLRPAVRGLATSPRSRSAAGARCCRGRAGGRAARSRSPDRAGRSAGTCSRGSSRSRRSPTRGVWRSCCATSVSKCLMASVCLPKAARPERERDRLHEPRLPVLGVDLERACRRPGRPWSPTSPDSGPCGTSSIFFRYALPSCGLRVRVLRVGGGPLLELLDDLVGEARLADPLPELLAVVPVELACRGGRERRLERERLGGSRDAGGPRRRARRVDS